MRDFNDLQFFAAVVTHRGFSAAARALGLPKSRVSRRVALLEERLGVRLLDRTTRGLGVTQVGQQVFEHARAAVIEAEAAEEAALRMQAEPRGLVRLSCPLGLQRAIAAPLPGFLAAHPLLRVQCIVTNRRVDLDSRRDRCCDPRSRTSRHRRRPANEADRRQQAHPCRKSGPPGQGRGSDDASGPWQASPSCTRSNRVAAPGI